MRSIEVSDIIRRSSGATARIATLTGGQQRIRQMICLSFALIAIASRQSYRAFPLSVASSAPASLVALELAMAIRIQK
jgi:hypothetical protein